MLKKRIRDKIKLRCKLEGVLYPLCFDCENYCYFYKIEDEKSCSLENNPNVFCNDFWKHLPHDWDIILKGSERIKTEILKKLLE